MSQTAYTNGQLAVLVSDLIARAKTTNTTLATGNPDFLNALQITLPKYAKQYVGNFYKKPAQASAPTVFPTAESALTNGSFFELTYPIDCMDTGMISLEIFTGTSNLVITPQTNIIQATDETTWDVSGANTTKIYWKSIGRNIRVYVPAALVSPLPKYTASYLAFPTYPSTITDTLLIPAEDFDNFFIMWMAEIKSI